MRKATTLVLLAACVTMAGFNSSHAQQQAVQPQKKQQQLQRQPTTAEGRQLDAQVRSRLAPERGGMSKAEWANAIGTEHPAYKKSNTAIPRGYGVALPLRQKNEVAIARDRAIKQAERQTQKALRQQGRPTDQRQVSQQLKRRNAAVAQANQDLARQRQAFESAARNNDRARIEALSEDSAPKSAPARPRKTREQMEADYAAFMDTVARKQGGRR